MESEPGVNDNPSSLDQPVESLAGVGKSRAQAMHGLEIHTLRDLLEYFPRDYRHESAEGTIASVLPNEICIVRGEVTAVNYVPARPRSRFEATIEDPSGPCALVWFNGAFLRTRIHPGQWLRVKGVVKYFRGLPQIANGKWEVIDPAEASIDQAAFRPIYPATAKLPSERIEEIITENLPNMLPAIEEWFEPQLLARHGLMSRSDAYEKIHRPADLKQAMSARRRIIYDELMLMQLGLGIARRMRDGRLSAPVLRLDKVLDERIRKRFPFPLTDAQNNAIWQIAHDLSSGRPMNRLLQGDVGSGKTSVAVYGMLVAVANRMQAALLAPTEVLAEQHYLTLSRLLADSQVRVELYTQRTKKLDKGRATRDLAEGNVHVAIGTQALLQEGISFANLGLVVVDEQHRLGVRQRGVLKDKGVWPHYLVMTATPIPRTLALSYFADFDLSIIDALPPGRQPIQTQWLQPAKSLKAWEFVRREVESGRQAYVVLPRIDDDAPDQGRSVTQAYQRLSSGPLAGLKLAMLHGQMPTDQKQATMSSFRDGQIDVLVATTVIEVGIDVPNATVIVIDGAEQFGLSQLHQLRGRVGRGKHASHCILIGQSDSPATEARLTAMVQSSDGFEIAEMDLKLRGPGEFFGTRQHGLPEFKLADLTQEMPLLNQAREDALAILASDPKLTNPLSQSLRKALRLQLGQALDLASIG